MDSKDHEVSTMVKVLVVTKVYPESVEKDLNELLEDIKKALPEGYEVAKHERIPVAFGLNLLKLYITMPEETEGGTSKLEEILKNVEGVSEVEIETVHRLSY
ncbi:elongation factor 1-beta [Ignicoccus pacificus DSM 13166]|uniref:Elongation factor 1-beta n=1 Tax=Ignicoccus pacificus DSM 13166 TaxID=940294 RepID=A0A977K9H1_9CREN|nr:elongation factor 1-beta [Ignicoccus pacificus DSM 13166]